VYATLKISYARCFGLSSARPWSSQFTLGICAAAWNRKKSLKPRISKVHGRSRSSMLIPPKSTSDEQVCVYLQSLFYTLDEPIAEK